jgi:hypothetical protein
MPFSTERDSTRQYHSGTIVAYVFPLGVPSSRHKHVPSRYTPINDRPHCKAHLKTPPAPI